MTALLLLLLSLPARADDALTELRRDLKAHPETANRETRTMETLAARLRGLGLAEVKTGVARTGLTAVVKGGKAGKTVAIRVPIDALEVEVAGVKKAAHACGHDALAAMAVGAAKILSEGKAGRAGDVRLIFQPAEEGAPAGERGGAPLMIEQKALDGVSAIVAAHVDDAIPCGEAGIHDAAVYAGADEFTIKVAGKAAHGATPWKGVDAVAAAAQVILALQQVVSRQSDHAEPVVLTVGTIAGGTRANSLAAEVTMTGTLRTYGSGARARAREALLRAAARAAEAAGAQASVTFTEEIPPVINDPKLAAAVRPVLASVTGRPVAALKPMSFADDFSFMSERVPSVYFQIGTRNEKAGITAATHTPEFDVDEACLPLGAKLLAAAAERLLEPGP